MFCIYSPRTILTGDFTIVRKVSHARVAPVLGIDEVGTLEGFLLIVFHNGIANELRIEFVTLGMSDYEVYIWSCVHPLCK